MSTAGLNAGLTLSNALNHRIERSRGSRDYVLFTLFGGLNAGLTALTLIPMTPALKAQCFRGLWIVSALSMAYWIRAILAFIWVSSRLLERLLWGDSGSRPTDEVVDKMSRARFTTRREGTGQGLEICAHR